MTDNYQNLANAIVLSAVTDYRKALHILSLYPKDKSAEFEKKQIEQFFRSGYYNLLTSVDGEMLISELNEEVKNKEAAI
jgi:hypothetical protein